MMEKEFDQKAYLIVIKSRWLLERAFDLYHGAARGESIAWQVEQFQQDLNGVAEAFDSFLQTTKGE